VHFSEKDIYVIPAKAGIHSFVLWIPDISLREIPE